MIKKFNKIIANNLVVFIGLSIAIFIAYNSLFNSYFESDEWFWFTYYLPLTNQPDGFLTAITSTIINAGLPSGGQHILPIGEAIFFLNTKFFGLNFVPYAFMSLLLHSINSFLVYLLIKSLLYKKSNSIKNVYSVLGAIFFALSPVPMHAVTWAGFYGQSVLSVTFSILCLLYYKFAFIKREKKFIYFSAVFLFLALFTKESTAFLFLLLPVMTLIERRVFSLKFLSKIFLSLLAIYLIFRFLVPNISTLPDKIVDSYLSSSSISQTKESENEDTGLITSRDISIHENLLGELTFRTITFPIKMTGSIFLPKETVFLIVEFAAPIISPISPGGDPTIYSTFLYGSGNSTIIYLGSISVIIFCLISILKFIRIRQYEEAKSIITGFAIIILGALPLVAIIFTFPRWGYDIYFDSRHYYNPAVGAAVLFPFLIFGIARIISKSFHIRRVLLVVLVLFFVWLINNTYAFDKSIKVFTQNYSADRRGVVNQLKTLLPKLPAKTVFYFETDGKNPFGGLPFFTSVPQALSVVYYEGNPLPDSFFNKSIFPGNSHGYQFFEDRGFGYYVTKRSLSDDIVLGKFNPADIYAFYYYGEEAKLKDITPSIRKEMEDYLEDTQQNFDWKKFTNSTKTFSLMYPAAVQMKDEGDFIQITSSTFNYKLSFSIVSLNFNLDEYLKVRNQAVGGEITNKKVTFDKYHFNEASIIQTPLQNEYYIKLQDNLFNIQVKRTVPSIVERILGSLEIIKK